MKSSAKETERMLDRLDGLYQRDPDAFESLRRQIIEHVIEGFRPDYQPRARAVQFALEARLARYKNPVARLNKMVGLFWEQFSQFQQVLNDPGATADARTPRRKSGKVIAFRKNDAHH